MMVAKDTATLSKRLFVKGVAYVGALAVTGCASVNVNEESRAKLSGVRATEAFYGPISDEPFPIPAVDLTRVPSQFLRRQVDYAGVEPAGTIIVDTHSFFLYLVQEDGKAIRYGVGLGRAGFEWSGRAKVGWKRKWPKWTPPAEMIARQPELEKYSAENGGMPPGIDNPLGARALYIFEGSRDTLYRIHGSPEFWTIGKAVSSGCVRMMNQDVIDLYRRVPTGSPIIVE